MIIKQLLFYLFLFSLLNSAEVDTVHIFSQSMNKHISAIVVVPDTYKSTDSKLPVVYLLHGYSGI